MNKKWLAVGALVVLAGAIAGILLLRSANESLTVSQKVAVSKKLAVGTSFGDNSLVYPGDREITEYNYVTGQSTAISTDTGPKGLQNSDSFSASSDKKYILFRNVLAAPQSMLYAKLLEARLDVTHVYWWVYDIQNKQFQPVPLTAVSVAKLDGNHLYAL